MEGFRVSRWTGSILARIEDRLCRSGIVSTFTWQKLLATEPRYIYAGDLRPDLPQYSDCIGLSPFRRGVRLIDHDVTTPMPIPGGSIDRYQSEDVFEHIEYRMMPAIFDEIFRTLRPGGLFRLSVPDYGFDLYRARCLSSEDGEILFDPAGGGAFRSGKVVGGGHQWFPTLDAVRSAFDRSLFASAGEIAYLHGYEADGSQLLEKIDYTLGHIKRTPDHDPRAQTPYRPMSIVVDAWKW